MDRSSGVCISNSMDAGRDVESVSISINVEDGDDGDQGGNHGSVALLTWAAVTSSVEILGSDGVNFE